MQLRESFTCQIRVVFCLTACESCNHVRKQSFRAIRSTAYCSPTRSQHDVHSSHPRRWWVHRQCALPPNPLQQTIARLSRHILLNFARKGANPSDGQRSNHVIHKMATRMSSVTDVSVCVCKWSHSIFHDMFLLGVRFRSTRRGLCGVSIQYL